VKKCTLNDHTNDHTVIIEEDEKNTYKYEEIDSFGVSKTAS